jgi:hypothetical protein
MAAAASETDTAAPGRRLVGGQVGDVQHRLLRKRARAQRIQKSQLQGGLGDIEHGNLPLSRTDAPG